jgi:hypothetical protein
MIKYIYIYKVIIDCRLKIKLTCLSYLLCTDTQFTRIIVKILFYHFFKNLNSMVLGCECIFNKSIYILNEQYGDLYTLES